MTALDKHIISADATVLDALDRLNRLSGSSMTLFVTAEDGRLAGTLTDGDVRRALLRGVSLDAPVSHAVNRNFKWLGADAPADARVGELRRMRRGGIDMVPVVDAAGCVTEIIDLRVTNTRLPLRALLMAGGKGERLRPLTLDCPKPLLQIEGKAIIDYNVEALAACGIDDITVATGYLAEKIYSHFEEAVAGVRVKCVRETHPLGTIGAATMLPRKTSGATLVMNSDLITTISFEELYLRHCETGADITVAVIPYQVAVPFAILNFDGDRVVGLEEKPSYSYYANAGIYIINNTVLDSLAPDTRTDATDLIEATIARGGRVAHYPIKGLWIDVGSPVDFRHAAELLQHHKTLSHGRF